MALSFPGTIELPHFEKTAFRVDNRTFVELATVKKSVLKDAVKPAYDQIISNNKK